MSQPEPIDWHGLFARLAQSQQRRNQMAIPKGFDPEYPQCPKCGGNMWDNRENKSGPRSPDFKCRDPQCGEPIWLTAFNRKPQPKSHPSAPPVKPAPATPAVTPIPRLTVEEWLATNHQVFRTVLFTMVDAIQHSGLTPEPGTVVTEARSLTASFWISCGEKLVNPHPNTAPAQEPAPEMGAEAEGYVELIKMCATKHDVQNTMQIVMQDKALSSTDKAVLARFANERMGEFEVAE